MTVKQLRELIADAADDALVVIPSSDHSYLEVEAERTTAVGYQFRRGKPMRLDEDFGDEYIDEGGKRVNVLLVGR
jgi:hypothetical protein